MGCNATATKRSELKQLDMEKSKGVIGGRRWAVEFTDNSVDPSSREIPDPLGFTRASQDPDDSAVSRQKKDAEANWKSQKAWEIAQAPFKNLLMMGFMMWMAGNTVHLFSIGITFSSLWQPLSALQGVGKVFEPFKDNRVDLLGPKLLFIALNLAAMGMGVWKLSAQQLRQFDGTDPSKPIYLAVKGRIFDVTSGKSFYGPGGAYEMFAGKDASRALAKMSKNEDDVVADIDGLSSKEIGVLDDWERKFEAKYPIVGRVV
ncbi:hypothetical protein QQ045_033050 [Rhodiola kirilowii]